MSELNPYKKDPRKSAIQRAEETVKNYWVVISLLVCILCIALYAFVTEKNSASRIDYFVNHDDPAYVIDKLQNIGSLSNFSSVISEELVRNFQKENPDLFKLNLPANMTDSANNKKLFDQAEKIVKGLKLISLQDNVLDEKHRNFQENEQTYERCKKALLESNIVMEDKSTQDLSHSNSTIVREETILQQKRDQLNVTQTKKNQAISAITVKIQHYENERTRIKDKLIRSANKTEQIKNYQSDLEAIQAQIRAKRIELETLRSQQQGSLRNSEVLEEEIQKLMRDIEQLKFDINSLRVDKEIEEIVGRVKRDEIIQTTKELISSIYKRINLYNAHKINNPSFAKRLEEDLKNDKKKLIDLNTLQINLIKSFSRPIVSSSGKTIEQLVKELEMKEHTLITLRRSFENRDSTYSEYERKIEEVEIQIRDLQMQESLILEEISKAQNNPDDNKQDMSTEDAQREIKIIEKNINDLKEQRFQTEQEIAKEQEQIIHEINQQKQKIAEISVNFTEQMRYRKSQEERILTDLNRCRQYRYLMETVQLSAQTTQEQVASTVKKLKVYKTEFIELLNEIIPDDHKKQGSEEKAKQIE